MRLSHLPIIISVFAVMWLLGPSIALCAGEDSLLLPEGVSVYRLDNGMEVLLIESTGLPMTGVNVAVKVGSAYDYDAMAFFAEQPGRESIELSADESVAWAESVRPMIDEKNTALKDGGFADDYEGFLLDRISYWSENQVSEEECSAWVKENIKSPSGE